MEGMWQGLIPREIGVGVGGAGSEGSRAELPESGPLWPAWQDSTQFPGTEGIWTGMITAPDMGKRNHQRASWLCSNSQGSQVTGGISRILFNFDFSGKENQTRDILKSSYWWLSNDKQVSWLLPPSAVIKIYTINVLSLSPWLFPLFSCFEVRHLCWKLPGLSSLLSIWSHKALQHPLYFPVLHLTEQFEILVLFT